jgi:hypothetical protein
MVRPKDVRVDRPPMRKFPVLPAFAALMRKVFWGRLAIAAGLMITIAAPAAQATPVCTDGYKGGPPLALCGGRIFPEAHNSFAYVQYSPYPDQTPLGPAGFREYQDGIDYLAQKYPRFVKVTKLSDVYGPGAVSVGRDGKRPGETGDTGGYEIPVIKITDNTVPDEGKKRLFFSLSIHANERGGLEGGLRTAEDLAMGATQSAGQPFAYIPDGYDNYDSSTGKRPVFHNWPVSELLKHEVLYLVDVNIDGWAVGDWLAPGSTTPYSPMLYTRGNALGTDLNRQMPTLGSINTSRNPLKEPETFYGKKFIDAVAAEDPSGLFDYGADIHGELTSQAYVDVMYPAGQFDSLDHRRLMDMAERTKSVIDKTLYKGIQDQIEEASGGNDQEGALKEPSSVGLGLASIPTKPAHWATVWDTLGYTDTGFLGDYLAGDVGVTGMDYEIFFNHTVPEKFWNVYLQENHINATRGIIKTAMAYSMSLHDTFTAENVRVPTGGRPGYVVNPEIVTDADGIGKKAGPSGNGIGQDGKPVTQAHYAVTNQQWFRDTNRYLEKPFVPLKTADIAADGGLLDTIDTLVLADKAMPADADGRAASPADYFANLKTWVQRGGNLVLTDRALHAVEDMGLVPKGSVKDVKVYQPYSNIKDFTDPLVKGLRTNARQLVEAAILGYGIGNSASPMSVVTSAAWTAAGGNVVGTTGDGAGTSDDGTQVSLGQLKLGAGRIKIIGGALPTPTETNDHRFGLRDYAPTTSGLFILENSLFSDAPALGEAALSGAVRLDRRADLACTRTRATEKSRRARTMSAACAAAARG